MKYDLLTILGPTAVGKTAVAAQVAAYMGGEILSGDSRQVYRGMDIGTGKDLDDYTVNGTAVPYHLIDIVDAGEKYNVHQYQKDFFAAYKDIRRRGKAPILCGGSGMYIDAVINSYALPEVPANEPLRAELEQKSDDELAALLQSLKELHNITDTGSRKRTIRAIEIAAYFDEHPRQHAEHPAVNALLIGLTLPVAQRRQRITERLHARLQNGLVEETERLLQNGIPPENLLYYGLEYKFTTRYLTGQLSYEQLTEQLNTAIHQFAKRQMTWFRGMERKGADIYWIDAALPMPEKVSRILERAAV